MSTDPSSPDVLPKEAALRAAAIVEDKIASVRKANPGRGGRFSAPVSFALGLLEEVRDTILSSAKKDQPMSTNELNAGEAHTVATATPVITRAAQWRPTEVLAAGRDGTVYQLWCDVGGPADAREWRPLPDLPSAMKYYGGIVSPF